MSTDVPRILHVTESMGGGVVSFLESITRRQYEIGADVTVLYAVRPDTPDGLAIQKRLGPHAKVLDPIAGKGTWDRALGLSTALRKLTKYDRFDVVHLHSSVAGAVGRVTLTARPDLLTVYSPHGFAFLREDKSRANQWATFQVERTLARRSRLIVTSNSELHIAKNQLRARNAVFLQSGVASSSIPRTPAVRASARPRIVTLGRLAFQKAPWRFAAVARALGHKADFVWVGSGGTSETSAWLESTPVETVAWVDPGALDDLLDAADIFLFPSLWEGMSLSLIHAQSRGVPAVTSNVVGNRDAVLHGVTGFVCDDDDELVVATERLIDHPELRRTMGEAAIEHARLRLVDDEIGSDSLKIYESWLPQGWRAAGVADPSRDTSP